MLMDFSVEMEHTIIPNILSNLVNLLLYLEKRTVFIIASKEINLPVNIKFVKV
jgi:hypothetical protein